MTRTLARYVRDGSLLLLAPRAITAAPSFGRLELNASRHQALLDAVQVLRGAFTQAKGALTASAIGEDGKHVCTTDSSSWHFVVCDSAGRVKACMRHTVWDRPFEIGRLQLLNRGIARSQEWGAPVRECLSLEIASAERHGVGFAEIGGWAVDESLRGKTVSLAMVVASYAFYRALGGARCVSYSTTRLNSATLLMRCGATPLIYQGRPIPPYEDPDFVGAMQVLAFDSNRPAPELKSQVEEVGEALVSVQIVGQTAPGESDARGQPNEERLRSGAVGDAIQQ